MSNFSDAIDGLAAALRAGMSGMNVYEYLPDSFQPPAAIIITDAIDPEIAFGGNTFKCTFRVVCLIASGDAKEGFRQLYDYIDPTTASKSIIKAVRDDQTLGGKVDSADVTEIKSVGRREVNSGYYFGFDATVEAIKTVA